MTRSGENFDDQTLGSFIDGLLDTAHSEKIIKAMDDDPEIREHVYQLRRSKDLMKLAYGSANLPPGKTTRVKKRWKWKFFSLGLAASVSALAILVNIAGTGHGYHDRTANSDPHQTAIPYTWYQPERTVLPPYSGSAENHLTTILRNPNTFLQEFQTRDNQI